MGVKSAIYTHWLDRKAKALVKRDRARGNKNATKETYKAAIDKAVRGSNGRDAYTGEKLRWHLVSKYDNDASRRDGRRYKATFGMLPTVDHVGDGTGRADFKICAWRTNDAKNDLSLKKFISLCRRVVAHSRRLKR
ncbi:MAG: hypothetical protein HYZ89_03680 [Candidatus Omnitrophica bacterium]|nr:hypothetical protein [Candidatus Omnitrophota bacterium]